MMAEEEEYADVGLSDKQKKEIAKWFLLNSPAGEIQFIAKVLKSVLNDDAVYNEAARGIPSLLVTSYNELDKNEYLDPRTDQVAVINHVKQVCTEVRPAADEELPSPYVEEYRCILDAEILKYVSEAYPKRICSVYCVNGKDVEWPVSNFELVVVLSAVKKTPKNFWSQGGTMDPPCPPLVLSLWSIEFKDDVQMLGIKGNIQVAAHYFEEGNVQLDAKHERKDETILQAPDDSAFFVANIIRHHEAEYLTSLEASYSNLPDATFKDLRRNFQQLAPYFHGITLYNSV